MTEAEKDAGVMVASNLKPSVQCTNADKKANMVLGQITKVVTFRDKTTLIRLCLCASSPQLCCSGLQQADKELLQRRAVMIVNNFRGSYEQRLAILKIMTLE